MNEHPPPRVAAVLMLKDASLKQNACNILLTIISGQYTHQVHSNTSCLLPCDRCNNLSTYSNVLKVNEHNRYLIYLT